MWVDDSQVYAMHHRKEYAWDRRIGLQVRVQLFDREALELAKHNREALRAALEVDE